MAVLNKIRQRSVFLIIIIALALFSFVLADVIRNGGFSTDKSQTTIATVNGEDIPRIEFMEQVEAYQRTLGPNSTSTQAVTQIWDRELRKVLLQQQYDELGMQVGEDAMDDAYSTFLVNNPSFQDEAGNFSLAKIDEYVASIQGNQQVIDAWTDYVKSTRQTVLENTYMNLVRSGLVTTLAEGEKEYRFENDKINIEFVQVPYTSIPDEDVTVTEAEIEAYVKANPSEFEVDPLADIQYVSFDETPSEADIEAARVDMLTILEDKVEYNNVTKANDTLLGLTNTTNIEDFVNTNSDAPYQDRWFFQKDLPASIKDTIFNQPLGAIYGPYQVDNSWNMSKVVDVAQKFDSVNSKHILIRYQGSLRGSSDITRSKEDAEKLADSLLAVLNRDKSKFDALVTEFTDDATTKEKAGELGYFGPGFMVEPFDNFIYNNAVGSIGKVETDFGYHVVKVEDQKNKQRVIKVATVSKEIEPSEETLNEVFAKATEIEVGAQDGDFNAVAEAQGVAVKPVNKIGQLDAAIPGIGNNRSIVTWAFGEDSKVGDVKRFSVPTGYVIAQLTRKSTEKGLLSIAEASGRVTPLLRNKKKAAKIREAITATSLEDIASSQGQTVKNAAAISMSNPTIAGAGREPEVIGAAFGKAAGETTDLIDGLTGVFAVRVLAVNNAQDLESYESFAEQLRDKTTPQVNNNVFQALKNAAEIEDNRAKFY